MEYIAFRKCRLLFDYIACSSSLLTHKLIEKLRRRVSLLFIRLSVSLIHSGSFGLGKQCKESTKRCLKGQKFDIIHCPTEKQDILIKYIYIYICI